MWTLDMKHVYRSFIANTPPKATAKPIFGKYVNNKYNKYVNSETENLT